uniref:HAD family hydrolase n=1 Tax=Flavobacterium sp. TaxID=239 RepID=UPI0040498CE1
MILPSSKIFVFDLDDTLYSERDFEKSGIEFVYYNLSIKHISLETILNNRNNWIEQMINGSNNQITSQIVLDMYRNHLPTIQLYNDAKVFLEKLLSQEIEMSLITDGRSITQRNKLKALGIESFFKNIVISEEVNSEKPSEYNFRMVMYNKIAENYIYIADNPKKDFITPNKLGWTSICLLDRGHNVHEQVFTNSIEYNPHFIIKSFNEINL